MLFLRKLCRLEASQFAQIPLKYAALQVLFKYRISKNSFFADSFQKAFQDYTSKVDSFIRITEKRTPQSKTYNVNGRKSTIGLKPMELLLHLRISHNFKYSHLNDLLLLLTTPSFYTIINKIIYYSVKRRATY